MEQSTKLSVTMKERKLEILLTVLYFSVSAIEVIAEYIKNTALIYTFKPMILLLLTTLYWVTSPKINRIYIAALLFSWLANLFFVSSDFNDIFIGASLFFFYRVLSIYIVIKHIRLPGVFPIVVGCVPFLFIYMYLINLTYEDIGEGLVIFITQCILISFLGGLSVGNYILRSNKASTMLLLSTLFFAVTQFIFVIRLYYVDVNIFQPIAMTLFVVGQYMFYKFIILAEDSKVNVQIFEESTNDSEIL